MSSSTEASRLRPLALEPLPLGAIRPAGWLANQLRIQADGLSGHLDEFWPDIAESGWIGGQAEGWERGPYWLDGVVPLAFLLDDEKLREKVSRWMDYILTHQHDDGWLGPEKSATGKYEARDPWPIFVMLKVMTQYAEATGDERVVPAMLRFLHCLDEQLRRQPLAQWSTFRWQDLAVSIHWLYDRTGEAWLADLADLASEQGYDWREHFREFAHTRRVTEEFGQPTHVVNNAMAVKAPGVRFRQSNDPADRKAVYHDIEMLDTYHGQATGVFTGDEHYAGKMPSQGTELCAVAEYMFSLEVLLSILADPAFGDRLESITFNALPATFKPDMWAHQYDQQANQVVCKMSEDNVYTNNGPAANIFGLAPNYGCCTANMHQGWPKFASHLWMRTATGGLTAVAYAPCAVETKIGDADVRVETQTDYPFDDTVRLTVSVSRPAEFELLLRIPAWADGAQVRVDGADAQGVKPGEFFRIEREWKGDTEIELTFPMAVRIERRYNNAAVVRRGPFVYSLVIGEDWKLIGGEPPHGDWEVHPTSAWNYALEIDEGCPDESVTFETQPVGDCPFSPDGAPITAKVRGRKLTDWELAHNAAAPPPQSPVKSAEPLEELKLIPYGCTNLRVTEFPTVG